MTRKSGPSLSTSEDRMFRGQHCYAGTQATLSFPEVVSNYPPLVCLVQHIAQHTQLTVRREQSTLCRLFGKSRQAGCLSICLSVSARETHALNRRRSERKCVSCARTARPSSRAHTGSAFSYGWQSLPTPLRLS